MSSDSALIASLRSLINAHGMAALEEAVTTLRSEHTFSSPRIRNHAEQWVHTLMDLRSERKKESWYSSSGWLMQLGNEARKEGLAPYLPATRSRENPNARQTSDQQTWSWFVSGIMSMFEISSFREAATKAKHFWSHTPLDIHPHNLFVSLPREKKIHSPSPSPSPSRSKRSQKQIEWSSFVERVQKKMNIASFRDACHAAKEVIIAYQKKTNMTNYPEARQAVYSIYSTV